MSWQQEVLMCAGTLQLEPEPTDHGAAICIALGNSRSCQKICIFA